MTEEQQKIWNELIEPLYEVFKDRNCIASDYYRSSIDTLKEALIQMHKFHEKRLNKKAHWSIEYEGEIIKLVATDMGHYGNGQYKLVDFLYAAFPEYPGYAPNQHQNKESDFTILLANGDTLKAIWHPAN